MFEALGQAALRTLLLACVVQVALWLFRIRQPQLRLISWTVVLAASLAMPVLQQVPALQTAFVLDIALPSFLRMAGPKIPVSEQQGLAFVLPESADPVRATWPWLEAVYFLIAGTLLLRVTTGVALSLQLLRRASPLEADWAAGTRVRISPDVTAPVTVLNVILLPADIAHWPWGMRMAVLAHERAHVKRWDYAMLLVAQLNKAVFWFSPLSWWLHRRLTALAELVSDDQALQATGDRSGYAEVLLEMGRRSGPLLRGLAMARPAMLVYRIERILRDGEGLRPVSWPHRSTVLIGAAGLAFAAASLEPRSHLPMDSDARAQDQEVLATVEAGRSFVAPVIDGMPSVASVDEQRTTAVSRTPSVPMPLAVSPTPRPRPVLRMAVRPLKRMVMRDTLPVAPARQVSWTTRETRTAVEAHAIRSRLDTEYEVPPPAYHQSGHQEASEPHLLKLIDQQTCSGVYLPGPSSMFPGDWLNMVSAKFFRNSDGTAWLTFHVGGRTPVNLPVQVTGSGVEFTGLQATTFKVVPKGANHLTGNTQHPYGTIDLACGGSNSHLFDGAG